jgi:micrococcal nuclease
MQFNANSHKIIKTHLKIVNVVDGDGLIVSDIFTKEEVEIRLLGIDAPEVKRCRKLTQDEKETRIAGELLIKLGHLSHKHLINLAPPNTNITIALEENNQIDFWGRTLAYVYLADGLCLNEKMIKDGYAKPFNEYYCDELSKYQLLNVRARAKKKGLYSILKQF